VAVTSTLIAGLKGKVSLEKEKPPPVPRALQKKRRGAENKKKGNREFARWAAPPCVINWRVGTGGKSTMKLSTAA